MFPYCFDFHIGEAEHFVSFFCSELSTYIANFSITFKVHSISPTLWFLCLFWKHVLSLLLIKIVFNMDWSKSSTIWATAVHAGGPDFISVTAWSPHTEEKIWYLSANFIFNGFKTLWKLMLYRICKLKVFRSKNLLYFFFSSLPSTSFPPFFPLNKGHFQQNLSHGSRSMVLVPEAQTWPIQCSRAIRASLWEDQTWSHEC